jgi:hypothetical protein
VAVRYLLDEHLRGPLWVAVQQHNAAGLNPIDVTRVGDPLDLPLGSTDPDILLWAEREGRILVSADRKTMSAHLARHLLAGRHSPGVFVVRPNWTPPPVVDYLVAFAYAGDPAAVADRIEFIP